MKKAKKVCIIGSHGVGKTTLSYDLARHYKSLGNSVKFVQEVARSSPFPLNEKMSLEACLWIYHEQVRKELEGVRNHDILICDRSAIDSFFYAMVMECPEDCYSSTCFTAAEEWMQTYDKIIYISLGNTQPSPDGFRSTDIDFQRKVDTCFYNLYNNVLTKNEKLITISSEDVFHSATVIKKLGL